MKTIRQMNSIESKAPAESITFEDLLNDATLQIKGLGYKLDEIPKVQKYRLKELLKRRFQLYKRTSKFKLEDQGNILATLLVELGTFANEKTGDEQESIKTEMKPEETSDEEDDNSYQEKFYIQLKSTFIDWLQNYEKTDLDEKLGIYQICMSKFEINLNNQETIWFIVIGSEENILNQPPDVDNKGEVKERDKDKIRTQWRVNIEKFLNISHLGVLICHTELGIDIIEEVGEDVFIRKSINSITELEKLNIKK